MVRGDQMIVLAMSERAHQSVLVVSGREPRQMLTHEDARQLGGDGLELAANLGRRVRLHVERVQVTRRAREKDPDHRPPLAASSPPCPPLLPPLDPSRPQRTQTNPHPPAL